MSESKRIGKYEIIEEIGRGGFAVVYKARDPHLDRVVALKVMAPHLLWDSTFSGRFWAEFQTVTRLRHPNIVSVYEYDEADGQPYIAMEYVPGVTMDQLLREVDGPLSLDRVLHIIDQLAAALSLAQRRGVVHRDIKPNNVMVDAHDRVKLTDFGIAKVAARTLQTTTGRIFGSPEYMSPEQVRGEELDHRSDVYSLGVVLYMMLTGQTPFTADTPQAIMFGHYEREPPLPSKLNPDLPASVETVVLKSIAKAREDRFQSTGELAYHLRRAIEGRPVAIKLPPPVAREREKGLDRSRSYLIGVLGGAGLVMVVVLTWILRDVWLPIIIPAVPSVIAVTPSPTIIPTLSPLPSEASSTSTLVDAVPPMPLTDTAATAQAAATQTAIANRAAADATITSQVATQRFTANRAAADATITSQVATQRFIAAATATALSATQTAIAEKAAAATATAQAAATQTAIAGKILWEQNWRQINSPLGFYCCPGGNKMTNREKLLGILRGLDLSTDAILQASLSQLIGLVENAASYEDPFWNMVYDPEIESRFDGLKGQIRDKAIEYGVDVG